MDSTSFKATQNTTQSTAPIATDIELFYKKSGNSEVIAPEVPENTEFFLCALGIGIRYNEITGKIEYSGFINGQDLSKQTGDTVLPLLRGAFIKAQFKISKSDLEDALRVTAYKYRYNPIQDYLRECHKAFNKEKGYIEIFFNQFILDSTKNTDKEFSFELFKKWLVGAVIMAFNDGDKSAQGVLTLKGEQGIGKTRFLFSLVPTHLLDYVKEGAHISKGSKDNRMQIMRKWFIELGELGSMITLQTVDDLKNLITESTDEIRKPYAKDIETVPRMCSFLGTVNDDKFLKDDTGERRWWVLPLVKIEPLPKGFDLAKMWGEVMELAFTENYPYWLTSEEIEKLNLANMIYKSETKEEQAIKDLLDWSKPVSEWREITATELCNELSIRGNYSNNFMGRALRRLHNSKIEPYCKIKLPTNHMKGKLYIVPPLKSQFEHDFETL